MKRYLFFFVTLALALSACQGILSKDEKRPLFINHPRPELIVDFGVFEDLGCSEGEADPDECEASSALVDFMCDEIRMPSSLLGALEPSYPIAKCLVMPDRYDYETEPYNARLLEDDEYFYNIGGLFRIFVRYVIFRDNQFELVENMEDFRSIYGPISSPEEALSYALAVQTSSAHYGRTHAPELDYLVEEIEDTYVESTQQGYLVHLFHYQQYGCGPHYTSSIDLLVTEDGHFDIAQSEHIFKDPEEDDLCAD